MPDPVTIIPVSASAGTLLQPSNKRLRDNGLIDLHARLYDEGKAVAPRIVPAGDLDATAAVLWMLVDCSTAPAIGFRDPDTFDETSPSNLDVWVLLDWQNTISCANDAAMNNLAMNPACQLGVTFNGQPFRAYGISNPNPGGQQQAYQCFKFMGTQQVNVPARGGTVPNNVLVGPGKQYYLSVKGGGSGFLAFDGATSQTLPNGGVTPGWHPHGETLYAVTALGANRVGGSRANYAYIAGTVGQPTDVTVDFSVGQFNGTSGGPKGDITCTLIKYENGDEVPWASYRILAGTPVAGGGQVITFTGTSAITVEDDYAVRIEYANPMDSEEPLFAANSIGNTIQTGAMPVLFYWSGAAPMVMTWHPIPELDFMLQEGEGFRGLAMHGRIYYNGSFGSNNAPNGDIAACKLSQPNGWRQIRDNCLFSYNYNPMQDIAVYGPGRDEMTHIVHANVNGLRWFEKTNLIAQGQMQSPWMGVSAFAATEQGAAFNWVDDIVEPAEYTLGNYTLFCIFSSNTANSSATQAKSDGFGCKFAMELSWAIERKVIRKSIKSEKPRAKVADWNAAMEIASNLPWAHADTGFSVMDLLFHKNMEAVMTGESYKTIFALKGAKPEHIKVFESRMRRATAR